MFDYRTEDGILIATMNRPGRSANLIDDEFVAALQQFLIKVETERNNWKGIVLASAKKTFIAGADLNQLLLATDPQVVFQQAEVFKGALRSLERCGLPVVAALTGAALGGGYEVALACHRRMAVKSPTVKVGLPEVSLGLIPGGGGITRLTRHLGLEKSLPLLTEGKVLGIEKALQLGLIDEILADEDELLARAKTWILEHPEAQQIWDTKNYRMPGGTPSHPKMARMLAIAPAIAAQKTFGNYPAVDAILNAAVEGAMVDIDTALRIESRYLAQIAVSPVAKNMISTFWFQKNQLTAGSSRPANFPQRQVEKLGILGAGMMGAGIAYVAARSGLQVRLKDVSLERAEKGKAYSRQLVRRSVEKGKITPFQGQALLDKIQPTAITNDLAACDLVIEAVFEDRMLKAKVTAETEALIADTAIFASNTSTLPISGLAEASARPGQFIGLHFFSPVDKMKLVEIIVGKQTTDETLARAFDFVLQIGKLPIVVNDSRGFYTSRVFATYVMEGARMVKEGISPQRVEMAGKQAGMPVGPLALMDEVSLALIHDIREQARRDFEASGKEMPADSGRELVKRMVEEFERKGKAFGKGFYEYPAEGKKYLWPELKPLFERPEVSIDQQTLKDRLIFIQALETVRCLEEGVLRSVIDANLGSIFGWGFAPFSGGTLQLINAYGLEAFVARSQALAQDFGGRFEPPAELLRRAADSEPFEA